MCVTRRIKLICFTLTMLMPVISRIQANSETSEEYLQKVMIQLQEFNVPSPINVYDKLSWNNDYEGMVRKNKDRKSYAVQRINMNMGENLQNYRDQNIPHYNVLPSEKIDLHRVDTGNIPQYYQPHVPTIMKVKEPEMLGITRAELAAMYKNALEKGSTVSLSSLTNALSTNAMPQVTDTHVELPIKQPVYQYYFFPFKTFMSELRKDHGYKTIPATAFDNREVAQTTQTQLSNPLFVAISTFITMAIVFMMSVLFLPKLPQFDILHSRDIQDDFFYLSNIITNAIDRYNLLEKFKGHRMDSVR